MFFVPHDVGKVMELLGGEERFLSRLEYFHTSGLADIGNEPVFLTVYMPHYAGRPGLSAERVHDCQSAFLYPLLPHACDGAKIDSLILRIDIPSRFNTSHAGLPGNDDSGAMASFTLFSMMGLFPNPGQNVYFITPPFFPSVSITNPLTNKTSTVRNVNFDNEYKRIYIQSATLNGEVYTRNWIGHEFFTEGWTLELVLGEEESKWGTGIEDRPPSMSTAGGEMEW